MSFGAEGTEGHLAFLPLTHTVRGLREIMWDLEFWEPEYVDGIITIVSHLVTLLPANVQYLYSFHYVPALLQAPYVHSLI